MKRTVLIAVIIYFGVSSTIYAILGDHDKWFSRLAVTVVMYGLYCIWDAALTAQKARGEE